MSLVAYGASDDSETSDVDESQTPQQTESGGTHDRASEQDGKISDEEEYVPTDQIQTSTASSSSVSSTREMGIDPVYRSAPSHLSDLPAPKAVGGGHGDVDGDDELEEEVRPKASQLADAPKPPPKKVKQPARIVLPALKKDSDDEEEESQKKSKPQGAAGPSGSRSGLFALLPAPVHSSRKQANRPLIPYTLTKRPAASKTTTTAPTPKPSPTVTSTIPDPPSQKHQSAFNALTGYESDSDEEEGGGGASSNFFSIGNEAEGASSSSSVSVVKNSAPSVEPEAESGDRTQGSEASTSSEVGKVRFPSPQSRAAPSSTVTNTSQSVSSSSSTSATASRDSSSSVTEKSAAKDGGGDDNDDDDDNEDEVSSSTVGIPQVNQDAPLDFSGSVHSASWSTAPLTSPMFPEMYAAPLNTGAATYWQRQQHYAQDYAQEEQETSTSSSSDFQQYMEDEQFLRISGKRKRGQEDIQIIDANVDDHVDPSELMKGMTEESSYQPHRKKENMPSMQQKRKKQITYLAFQAKERELELKNAWSQNRTTKNQARSKYGF